MSLSSKEAILAAARRNAQAHGYSGLNFRDLAHEVGIKGREHLPSFPEQGRSRRSSSEALLGGHSG
jgi:TetR/AcrR family transcriptional repressor of nem operon